MGIRQNIKFESSDLVAVTNIPESVWSTMFCKFPMHPTL